MSGFEDLQALFKRRLLAAVIRDQERPETRSEYEEELHCQRKLLDVILLPEIKLHRAELPADAQQQLGIKEESLQEDTEPPLIKEEQEELWIGQEGERFQGLEEEDTKLVFSSASVKSEDDEEKPQSSQLHERQNEELETGADGEDCGGAEAARISDPETHLQPETEAETEESSGGETDDSDDWRETGEHQSGSNSAKHMKNKRPKSKKSHSCSLCGKTFSRVGNLTRHTRSHTGEKPFSCSVCSKRFTQKNHMDSHMITHSGEKPFSCSECDKGFCDRGKLNEHMRIHTGEKPFSCSVCSKTFRRRTHMVIHMLTHSEEKPFSCSVCSKRFTQKGSMDAHMRIHTGEKPFSCSGCSKRFKWKQDLVSHMRTHSGEKLFSCSVCGNSFKSSSNSKVHMKSHRGQVSEAHPILSDREEGTETGADGEDCREPAEPARNSDPERHLHAETEVEIVETLLELRLMTTRMMITFEIIYINRTLFYGKISVKV